MVNMEYVIPILEDELYAWVKRPCWPLPRPAVVASRFFGRCGRRFKCLPIIGEGLQKQNVLLIQFASPSVPRRGADIPFYAITQVQGFSEAHVEIVKDRYGNLRVPIVCAPENVIRDFDGWWMECEKLDFTEGAKRLPSLFDLHGSPDAVRVADEVYTALRRPPGNVFASNLLSYSRGEPWPVDGLIAAICDLGKILRLTSSAEVDGKRVSALADLVGQHLKKNGPNDWPSVCKILDGFTDDPRYGVANVLFLAWKFAMERKSGSLDFELMQNHVRTAESSQPSAVIKALALFGAFVGFGAFAETYHIHMRESLTKRESGMNVGIV